MSAAPNYRHGNRLLLSTSYILVVVVFFFFSSFFCLFFILFSGHGNLQQNVGASHDHSHSASWNGLMVRAARSPPAEAAAAHTLLRLKSSSASINAVINVDNDVPVAKSSARLIVGDGDDSDSDSGDDDNGDDDNGDDDSGDDDNGDDDNGDDGNGDDDSGDDDDEENDEPLYDFRDLFPNGTGVTRSSFPADFLFGTITSSMKHEGAEHVDGKSLNIWDQYASNVKGATLDGAIPGQCGDNYFRYPQDHQLVVDLGMNAYRLSIAWSRVYPDGTRLNQVAIDHYNNVINDALDKGLEIIVTLWTQDHPYVLDNTYGGPLNATFIDDFVRYANTCFAEFGDRVKKWITFDEPNDYAGLGYATNMNPPGRCTSGIDTYGLCFEGDSGTEPYIVGHNLLLAHAEASHLYRTTYQEAQNGSIGVALWTKWFEPLTNTSADIAAAQRAQDFLFGWFVDPLLNGDYPATMKEYAGSRLPTLTSEQIEKVNGSINFLGINIVTAFYAYDYNFYETDYPDIRSYYLDSQVAFTGERDGEMIGVGSHDFAVPWCIKAISEYVKTRYYNIPVYITQTGWGITYENETSDNFSDDQRVEYFQTYYEQLSEAIADGANVKGVFAWSLFDGFEFNLGMQIRFGLHFVDHSLTRYARKSALWFKAMLSEYSPDQAS